MSGAPSGCRIVLPDPDSTVRAGRRLASALRAQGQRGCGPRKATSLHLSGPLGAGKTTLVRGLMRGLGHRGPVRSPTYTLLEPYELEGISVYHFDLYRLAGARELEDFGARDYFHDCALCVVEWPERGTGALPSPDLLLDLRVYGDGRLLVGEAVSRAGQRLLDKFRFPSA